MAARRQRPPKVPDLLALVKRHLDDGTYLDTRHVTERKRKRGITLPEILAVLRGGDHEKRKDEFKELYNAWTYAIAGRTVDSRRLRVCVSFDEPEMLLITAIELDDDK